MVASWRWPLMPASPWSRYPVSTGCTCSDLNTTYPVILPGRQEAIIGKAQQRAIQNYRSRLGERGLARFEVLGRDADRDLIRSLARWLAEDTPEASQLRAKVISCIAGEPPGTGGILAALRRSPLVGADLDLTRPRLEGREVDT